MQEKLKTFGKRLTGNLGFAIAFVLITYGIDYLYSFYHGRYKFVPAQPDTNHWLIGGFIISMISHQAIRATLILLILTTSLFQFLHYQYFGTYVQPIGFSLIFTDFADVSESFFAEFLQMLVPLAIVGSAGAAAFFLNRRFSKLPRHKSKPMWLVGIAYLCFSLYQSYDTLKLNDGKLWQPQAKALMPLETRHSYDNMQKALRYYALGIVPRMLNDSLTLHPDIGEPAPLKATDLNIVLIFGESLRADQVSLLGYEKPTMPRLSERDKLFANRMISAGTMTKTAAAALFNRLEFPGSIQQISSQSNCMFRLAKKMNYTTHFVSAQKEGDLTIMSNMLCQSSIDNFLSRDSYGKTHGTMPELDIGLLEYVKRVDFNQPNLLVLQQRGSHSPYEKQYAPPFNQFETHYDNSVLYTDFVLDELINYIESATDRETHVFFTSDHGELLGEDGLSSHGWFRKQVYEVPFFYYPINVSTERQTDLQLEHLRSHYDLSTLVTRLMGYDVKIDTAPEREIYVNGSDVGALAGFLKLNVVDGTVVKEQVFP